MSKPAINPIDESDFSKLLDPLKIMDAFKMPGFDISVLVDIQGRNAEMMATINQAAIANLQSFAQRQTELAQHVFEEAAGTMNILMSAATPQEKVVCQAETSKKLTEQCMANVRDTAENFAKCNTQAMATVSNRMSDTLVELRALTKTKTAG